MSVRAAEAVDGGSPEDRDPRTALVRLLQDYAVEANRLGQVFADRNDMHPTDLHALLALMQAERGSERLTPGRLGDHLGLSSGATTAVIDRLERAGHVRREGDGRDRRRVTLRRTEAAVALGAAFFGPLGRRMEELLAEFSAGEVATVRRFLARTNAMMRAHREQVGGAPPVSPARRGAPAAPR